MAAGSFFGAIRKTFFGKSSPPPTAAAPASSSSSSSSSSSDPLTLIGKSRKEAFKVLRNSKSSDVEVIASFIATDYSLNELSDELNERVRKVASKIPVGEICRLDVINSRHMKVIHVYKFQCMIGQMLGVNLEKSEFSQIDFCLTSFPKFLNHYVFTDTLAQKLASFLKTRSQHTVLNFFCIEDSALIGGIFSRNTEIKEPAKMSGVKVLIDAKMNGELPYIKHIIFTVNQLKGYKIDNVNIPGFSDEDVEKLIDISSISDQTDSRHAFVGMVMPEGHILDFSKVISIPKELKVAVMTQEQADQFMAAADSYLEYLSSEK